MASYLRPFPPTKHGKLRYHIPTLTSFGLWCVPRSSPTLNLPASYLPMVHGPAFLRDDFVRHLPLPSHIVFPSSHPTLFTYLHWSPPRFSCFLSSQPPVPLSAIPPPPQNPFSPAPEQSTQIFPPVSSGQHSPKILSAHREPSPASQQPVSKQGDGSSCMW